MALPGDMNRPPQQPSISPPIPPSCRPSTQPANPCCVRQYNSFLCWLALYEKLMVIAHRCHIRVRQWGERESALKRIFRGGKMEVIIVVSRKQRGVIQDIHREV